MSWYSLTYQQEMKHEPSGISPDKLAIERSGVRKGLMAWRY